MGLNGSLSGISFSGIGSGIDSDTIIRQLMQIERLPLQRLQVKKEEASAMRGIYSQLRGRIAGLTTAASALNSANAFSPVKGVSSDSAVATVTTGTGSIVGTYQLAVSALAKAHKVSSSAQANVDQALGFSGSFVVNGKAVSVDSTDTLTSIASKINGLGVGVTASVLNAGTNAAYLTVAAQNSGVQNKVQIGDLSGTALASLGFVTGAAAVREQVGADAMRSVGFSSSTTVLQTLTGATKSGSFTINGVGVAVDFATDSLATVASKINAAGAGATASVVTISQNGQDVQKLQIQGATVLTGTVDSDGVLEALGVFQKGYASQLTAGQDASFTIDGIAKTSSSNTITDVIPGSTVTLLKADATTPPTTTLTLTRDTEAIQKSVQGYVDAYNSLAEFIKEYSEFDSETFASGPLFGDSLAAQVQSTLDSLAFTEVAGGTYKNLTQVGVTLGTDGKLALDGAKLESALATDPTAVKKLFMATGTTNNAALSYISSTNKSKSSSPLGYTVEITQLATKGSMVGNTAQSSPGQSETLTFSGSAFGGGEVELYVSSGGSASDLVNLINTNSSLKDVVEASLDGGGKLVLTSKRFGTPGDFTVVSDKDALPDTSGIGTTGGVYTAAVNVAGKINGEAATGLGQFLTGNAGVANTDGLQLQYTGTTLGTVGNLVFSRGVATVAVQSTELFTDSVAGILTASDKSLEDQITEIDLRVTEFETLLTSREATLRQRFLAMERAISQLQLQQQRLSGIGQG